MVPFHRRCRRLIWLSSACSGALHGALAMVAVGLWLVGLGLFDASSTPAMLTVAAPHIEAETFVSSPIDSSISPAQSLLDGEDLLSAMSDPRWQALVEPASQDEEPVTGIVVTQEIARITRAAERRSVDENLSRLNSLTEQIGSERAVDDISTQLSQVLQTEERANRPAEEPIEGEFDFTTAQLHDVLKKEEDQGGVVYWAVLVDAAGRKFESPMEPSAGETAFRTMNLIKTNPLLERVYRGVVMSMMDQVLKGTK